MTTKEAKCTPFHRAWTLLNQSFEASLRRFDQLEPEAIRDIFKSLEPDTASWRQHPIELTSVGSAKPYLIKLPLLAQITEDETALSLGAAPRCYVIKSFTDKSNKNFFSDILGTGPDEQKFLTNLLSPHPSRGFARGVPFPAIRALKRFVNDDVRKPLGLPPLTAGEIFESEFTGLDALDQFERFLIGAEPRRQPFLPNNSLKLGMPDDPRRELLNDLVAEVMKEDQPNTLLNVYARGLWRGLTAFGGRLATHLDLELEKRTDDRRCLYIPLRETRVVAESEQSGELKGTKSLTFLSLLGILRHFFVYRLDDIHEAKSVTAHEDVFEIVHQIRIGMVKRSRVLIIDGVFFPERMDALGSKIERVIEDDQVFELLIDLFDIPLTPIDTETASARAEQRLPLTMDEFRKNRIILLSNRKISEAQVSVPHMDLRIENFKLTHPQKHQSVKVIRGHKLINEKILLQQRELNLKVFQNWSDVEYYAFDALLSASTAAGIGIEQVMADLQERRLGCDEDQPYIDQIMAQFAGSLPEAQSLANKILFLISLAPDGLRHQTLVRLIVNSVLSQNNSAFITRTDLPSDIEYFQKTVELSALVVETTRELCASYPTLINACTMDEYPGIDNDLPHDLEFGAPRTLWHKNFADAGAPISIKFVFPEFRTLVRENWSAKFDRLEFRKASALLCEEALTGQTISLRHNGVSPSQSISVWRRQFAAVYHGLNSLEIETNTGGLPRVAPHRTCLQYTASYPTNPRKFFRWLYLFGYRRMIENPPEYAISRRFGEDKLRKELLGAFGQPWSLLPRNLLADSKHPNGNLIEGEFLGSETDTYDAHSSSPLSIVRSYFIANTHANNAIGDMQNMKFNLDKLKTQKLSGSSDTAYHFSIYKRLLDMGILNLTSLNEIHMQCPNKASPIDELMNPEVISELDKRLRRKSEVHANLVFKPDASSKLFTMDADAQWFCREIINTIRSTSSHRGWKTSTSAKTISVFCDIIYRLAEHKVTFADLALQGNRNLKHGEAMFHRLGICNGDGLFSAEGSFASLCFGYSMFMFAESLRLEAFKLDPLSNSYLASGHALRVAVRTGLKLQRISDDFVKKDASTTSDLGPFGLRARHDLNVMTRHLFSFPRERGSQLLLEASKTRLLMHPRDAETALPICRELVGRAEPVVMSLGHTSRARLRLSLERGKVHRALSRFHLNEGRKDQSKAFFKLAELDQHYIRILTTQIHGYSLWEKLAEYQEQRLNQLSVDIGF